MTWAFIIFVGLCGYFLFPDVVLDAFWVGLGLQSGRRHIPAALGSIYIFHLS